MKVCMRNPAPQPHGSIIWSSPTHEEGYGLDQRGEGTKIRETKEGFRTSIFVPTHPVFVCYGLFCFYSRALYTNSIPVWFLIDF